MIETGRASGFLFAWPGAVVDKEDKEAVHNSFTKGAYIALFTIHII